MHLSSKPIILCGAVACLLTLCPEAYAQDATRPSVINSHIERSYSFVQPDYNLKLGPVTLKLDAGVRTEFNDNIRLAEENKQSDVIITPEVGIQLFWPVTPFNSLSLSTRFGYAKYLDHSELDGRNALSISPDSDLNFNMYLGHVKLNFHDRFSIEQDPVNDPAASNVVSLGRFLNSVGVVASWELNSQTTLTLGYDHSDSVSLTPEFEYTDYAQDQVFFSTRHVLGRGVAVGLEGGAASTRYTDENRGDSASLHGGVYADWIVNPYTRLRVAGGLQSTQIDGVSATSFKSGEESFQENLFFAESSQSSSENNSFYANVEVVNRLTNSFTQTLSAGKENTLGVTSQGLELIYVRYTPVWNVSRKVNLNGVLFFDNGKEFGTNSNEKFTRIGAAVSTSYRLSTHLTGNIGYRFTRKNSDEDLQSYTQNLVFAGLNYAF